MEETAAGEPGLRRVAREISALMPEARPVLSGLVVRDALEAPYVVRGEVPGDVRCAVR